MFSTLTKYLSSFSSNLSKRTFLLCLILGGGFLSFALAPAKAYNAPQSYTIENHIDQEYSQIIDLCLFSQAFTKTYERKDFTKLLDNIQFYAERQAWNTNDIKALLNKTASNKKKYLNLQYYNLWDSSSGSNTIYLNVKANNDFKYHSLAGDNFAQYTFYLSDSNTDIRVINFVTSKFGSSVSNLYFPLAGAYLYEDYQTCIIYSSNVVNKFKKIGY